MNYIKYLFIDRDGTLIEEPTDFQIDSIEKFRLLPEVISSLLALQKAGYRLVMVSNQDGLGTDTYPQQKFDLIQKLLMGILESQGVHFESVLICPHFENEKCSCRKPQLGLVRDFAIMPELDRSKSFVIGDRQTDLLLAENMGIGGIRITPEKGWQFITTELLTVPRLGAKKRKTKETEISVQVNLDGAGSSSISTGIGFLNHMLEQLSHHGSFKIQLDVKGDLHIDDHHTIEDTAIVLGGAIRQALGDKTGIERFGFYLPMDDSSAQVSLDLSGRSYFKFEGKFQRETIGGLSTEMIPHFFRSFSESLGANLHIKVEGENTHHQVEAVFKAVGRSLRTAIQCNTLGSLPSTKGFYDCRTGHWNRNSASVLYALERMGYASTLTRDPDLLISSSRVIFPGVGTASALMNQIHASELNECLRSFTQPVLGICLGMQSFYEYSDEGMAKCLGILPGNVRKLQPPLHASEGESNPLPVPHMGWNSVQTVSKCQLMNGIPEGSSFYFVHSYRVPEGSEMKAVAEYGVRIPAIIESNNWFGTQFHPERSGAIGEKLLQNFLNL